jgi:hypothetical protein
MKIVRTRSIPNVDDDRIIDSARQICATIHGTAAIRAWSDSRRAMVNIGIKIAPIRDEMIRRGITNPNPACCICTGRKEST